MTKIVIVFSISAVLLFLLLIRELVEEAMRLKFKATPRGQKINQWLEHIGVSYLTQSHTAEKKLQSANGNISVAFTVNNTGIAEFWEGLSPQPPFDDISIVELSKLLHPRYTKA